MRPEPSFHLVGISHHTARVEERERYALTRADTAALLQRSRLAGQTAIVLSTCNRVEYYWTGEQDGDAWLRSLARARGADAVSNLVRLDGTAAIRHLFVVAAGLDSQVLGETEILGQVRRAYDAARAEGTTTREMDLIFSAALSAGRRVRRETVLGRHPASVSSAAVGLIADQWDGGRDEKVVVVMGAGEAAEGILRALQERGVRNVALLCRRPERSRTLAQAWGASIAGMEQSARAIGNADLLIVATSSAHPVVSHADLDRVMAPRANWKLSVIDLGIPRNVEPTARNIIGVELFDLDDLQRLCCPAAAAASEALLEAERLIDDELARLGLSLRGHAVAPRLAELHRLGIQLAEEESNRALDQLGDISPSQREVVRQMADRLVRRVLYPVSRGLRQE
ncbi:MAG TPA: glutamyl-tRNA reductase [Gemmatimonadales bacterium]|nr:glutamyl-tRNA reductase [Gemmatimonadales bacterium]